VGLKREQFNEGMWHSGLHRGHATNGGNHHATFRAKSDFQVFGIGLAPTPFNEIEYMRHYEAIRNFSVKRFNRHTPSGIWTNCWIRSVPKIYLKLR
jgi:hypothetical protein